MRDRRSFAMLVGMLLMIGGATWMIATMPGPPPSTPAIIPPPPPRPSAPPIIPGVTLANFRLIHQHTSIPEMEKILGRPADHTTDPAPGVQRYVLAGGGQYLWFGTEGFVVIIELPEAKEGFFRAGAYSDAEVKLLRGSREAALKERYKDSPEIQQSIWSLKP